MQLLADASCGFVGIRLMYPDDRQVQHGGIKIMGESPYVCGFHRTDHARQPGEFVAVTGPLCVVDEPVVVTARSVA